MADSKLKNTEQVKYKAVSGRMSDYFEFKLCDDGTVYSAENIFCVICHKSFAYCYNYVSLIIMKFVEN